LLLWERFTWSLAWTGSLEPIVPPAISIARFEMTSLAFMLLWVPDPVCQMRRGKCASRAPEITSSAALSINAAMSGVRSPSSAFVLAAAFLTMPRA